MTRRPSLPVLAADVEGREASRKEPFFSHRTGWDTSESTWARLLRERREAGLPLLDLTISNPTRCGFDYDIAPVLAALSNPAAMDYDPDPRGLLRAREAVCRYYAAHAAEVATEQVFLTTSTSEAYSFLFRLLCDPGDEVLIAQPSYPLFDFLAALDDVRLVPYPLFYDYGWHLDIGALRERITPRTRAIVVVNPNNPTGHYTGIAERGQLEAICARHGLALIVDEVFLDYPIAATPPADDTAPSRSFAAGEHPVLTFVLSGLSKVAALPQMKVAWLVCRGPAEPAAAAMTRLEVIADTFLSMNAPAQYALPAWLGGRESMQRQIRERVAANLAEIDLQIASQTALSRLEVEAGWSAILRVPAIQSDDEIVEALLKEKGVAVNAGSLFGFSREGHLVVSLLTPKVHLKSALTAIWFMLSKLHSNG